MPKDKGSSAKTGSSELAKNFCLALYTLPGFTFKFINEIFSLIVYFPLFSKPTAMD